MFGKWLAKARADEPVPCGAALTAVVQSHLPEADAESVRVVIAIAGLLAAVAYADREYSAVEEHRVRAELARVHGMTARGVDAIADALRRDIVELATVELPRSTRTMVELADEELRLETLEVLVEVAAADGHLSHTETTLLRQIATSLGLTQDDYNRAQARHRDKLGVLRG
ncbi:MAG: TerB family tellurite resistance protein [Polyangiaceae bacterium]|nr:TerB family tellurite resistance protein [Polyangiaceae bacterium]